MLLMLREPPMTAYTDTEALVTEAEIDDTVALFYGRAREDSLLGPVFRGAIPDRGVAAARPGVLPQTRATDGGVATCS
jgi:hypothetical protein